MPNGVAVILLRPDVPVIMITAYGDAETKRKALEGGAEALLSMARPSIAGTMTLLSTGMLCSRPMQSASCTDPRNTNQPRLLLLAVE
jgi:CheY-like chemotaxis protein